MEGKCKGSTTWEWWMPSELDLRGNDLTAYALVWCFSKDGKGEFKASWSQFAARMGVVTETAGIVIARLVRRGLIERRCVMTPRGKSYRYWVTQQYTEHFPQLPPGRKHANEALELIPRSRVTRREDTIYPHRNVVEHMVSAPETICKEVVETAENTTFLEERNHMRISSDTIRTRDYNNNDKAKNALSFVTMKEQTQPNPTASVKNIHGNESRGHGRRGKSKSRLHDKPKASRRTKRSMRRDKAIELRSECHSHELSNVSEHEFESLFSEAERRWACRSDGLPGDSAAGRGDRFLDNRAAEMDFCRPTLDALVGACGGDVSKASRCLSRMDFSGRKRLSYVVKDTVENDELLPRIIGMVDGIGVCACAVIPEPKW